VSRFVELNHVLRDGMPPYPGLPTPRIGAFRDHAASRPLYGNQAEFYLGTIEMPCNVGTYLDSPFHRYPDGEDLSQVPLEMVAGLPGIVLDAAVSSQRAATVRATVEELQGRAVLIRTGWDQRWGTPRYWEPGPYLSGQSLDLVLRARPALVGVDFWNIDDTQDPARPAHTKLLGARILIVEHLANLGPLPRTGFRFSAVPLRIARGASFPVRAFAEVEGE
jgi:kynurenine formamidase